MKFFNYKRYKFSTIFKNISFKRYNFKKIFKYLYPKDLSYFKINKYVNLRSFDISRLYKYIDLKNYRFLKLHKYTNPRNYNYSKIYKYINPVSYNYSKLYKFINLKNYRYILIFTPVVILSSIFIYLSIPIFYDFDKSKIENLICKGLKVNCSIEGKIRYSFLPSPRIKLTKFVIKDLSKNNKTLANIKNIDIKIALKNLQNKKKIYYKKINLKNGEINFNLKNLRKYKNIFKTEFNLKNINLKEININFLDGKKDITTIKNVVIKYKSKNKIDKVNVKGDFLGDIIVINLKNNRNEKEAISTLKFKLTNSKISSKIVIKGKNEENDFTTGNFSIKKDKNKLMAIFDYRNDQIVVKKGNIKNIFLEGKFTGLLKILPYFNFDLDLNLDIFNFNKLSSILNNLNNESRKNLFKVNEKINGGLTVSADKIYSKHSLFKSFESRLKFMNGDIFVEQVLLSLGNLGAADLSGVIKNDSKFINFKFENNLFIDNLKKFYNKFGVYNKPQPKAPGSLFISGNFDLLNLNMRLHEIVNEKKVFKDELDYYEKEFNNIFLEDGYKTLLQYSSLKKFVKLISDD
jgi:hypothetical protein